MLKFERKIRINESIMRANFEDRRSRDCELKRKKTGKPSIFWIANLLIRL